MRLIIDEDDDEKCPMLQNQPEMAVTTNGQNGTEQKKSIKKKRSFSLRGAAGEERKMPMARIGIQGLEFAEPNSSNGTSRLDFLYKQPVGSHGPGVLERLIRRKFVLLFLFLSALALLGLAVLMVVLVVLRSLQHIDEKIDERMMAEGQGGEGGTTQSERYMRLYEQLMRFRSSPYMITDSMIPKMPPDELEQAKAAGILPIDHNGTKYESGGPEEEDKMENDTKNGHKEEEKEEQQKQFHPVHEWYDPKCEMKCEKDDVSIPPLVVISLDGFARHYLNLGIVKALDRMANCGARAEFMFPSFPSKTFPNHYTIATGLWPEAHGIIDNAVYDPEISPELEDMKNPKYAKHAEFYGGEPIWSSAVRHHKRVFCLFWPGCSFNITGFNPTIDVPYNGSFSYSKRVDKIVEWLSVPAIERPALILGYFDQPDNVGHFHTSNRQVELELIYLETVLDYLFSSLHRAGILDCINLIILSDHGMQWLHKRYILSEMLPPIPGMITSSGVIGHVYLPPNRTNDGVDQIMDKFACFDKQKFHVYDRKRMPKRYHYAKGSRMGDVIFDGQLGTTFYSTQADDFHVTSDHGYDYLQEQMHAIFFARGPNIRQGARLDPFQNVELFNLFTDLLRLPHDVPNNGTRGVLNGILLNMDSIQDPPFDPKLHPLSECPSTEKRQLIFCADDMIDSAGNQCNEKIAQLRESMDNCTRRHPHPPLALFYTRSPELCIINLCPSLLLTSNGRNKVATTTTMVYESLSGLDFPTTTPSTDSIETCRFINRRFDQKCENWREDRNGSTDEFVWRSIAATGGSAISGYVRLQFPMFAQFANGPFLFLQNLTQHYARRYSKMLAITGTIFDENMDGIADNEETKSINSSSVPLPLPTHFFRVLIRCEDDAWHVNGINCKAANATRVLTFVLPNSPRELNCLDPREYLLVNSARVRDVELLTGVQFFAERMWYPEREQTLWWRTNITTQLWD